MRDVTESGISGPQPPLYDRIMQILSAEIASGRLAPGARLMETRVAERFGVSRAPARQALMDLEAAGAIVHADAPARGYRVAEDAAGTSPAVAGPTQTLVNLEVMPSWQRIYSDVEDAIAGRIAFGGWRINETALGEHYGVSRTVAREVLARLQSGGLVVHEGKRWIAPGLSDTRVRELYELRAVLEPSALAGAIDGVPTAMLNRMIANLESALGRPADGQTLDNLERELHFDLLRRCPNAALRRAMAQSQSLVSAHRFFYGLTADMYSEEPFLAEHLAVLEPLVANRLHDSQEALRTHLAASSDRAVDRAARVRGLARQNPIRYLEMLPPNESS